MKKIKTKLIEFGTTEKYITFPKPARNYIPKWYKDAEQFIGGKPIVDGQLPIGKKTIKTCVPFLDALTTGYIVELWQDVLVRKENGQSIVSWNHGDQRVVGSRPVIVNQGLPAPIGHSDAAFLWDYPFITRTPKGYSVFFTHPINRFDLPFTTLTGVMDTDGVVTAGSIPFFIKEDFEGIIPCGTPIAQIFPFKRDNWESKDSSDELVPIGEKIFYLSKRVIRGWYKQNSWKKKNWN
jgi:hypothetical protein